MTTDERSECPTGIVRIGMPSKSLHNFKPDMARTLFDQASEPKELWIVDKAKHNQAFHLANEEYKRRVLAFFDRHLAATDGAAASLPSGTSGV